MASGSSLHIISFDVPYPANYGGVIDIFYKIKALHAKGVKVILHCFVYAGRTPQEELNEYCEQVYYYERNEKFRTHLAADPYIVQSRKDERLLENLAKDDFPILFEGLHTCGFIGHRKLWGRKKLVRMHNIEWQYYLGLIPQAASWKNKLYYGLESYKLKKYEKVLFRANTIFAVSDDEVRYCSVFAKTIWLPAFHGNTLTKYRPSTGQDRYVIFHGNLDITDNQIAARLLDEISAELNVKCVITGKNVGKPFTTRHATLVTNPEGPKIQELIENAQVCFVHSAFANGVKLKLLYSLFSGRFVISNRDSVTGTKLDGLVIKAETKEGIKKAITEYLQKDFTEDEFENRKALLLEYYDDNKNAELILKQL